MIATVRYVGRVYDVVSYEAVIYLETPTDIDKLMAAEVEVKKALIESHPSVFNIRTRVEVGFGYKPPIAVVAEGVVNDCIECGCEGHRPIDCPTKKSE